MFYCNIQFQFVCEALHEVFVLLQFYVALDYNNKVQATPSLMVMLLYHVNYELLVWTSFHNSGEYCISSAYFVFLQGKFFQNTKDEADDDKNVKAEVIKKKKMRKKHID